MYTVIPWDEPDKKYVFNTFIEALQFGNGNFGSRYDLIESED